MASSYQNLHTICYEKKIPSFFFTIYKFCCKRETLTHAHNTPGAISLREIIDGKIKETITGHKVPSTRGFI